MMHTVLTSKYNWVFFCLSFSYYSVKNKRQQEKRNKTGSCGNNSTFSCLCPHNSTMKTTKMTITCKFIKEKRRWELPKSTIQTQQILYWTGTNSSLKLELFPIIEDLESTALQQAGMAALPACTSLCSGKPVLLQELQHLITTAPKMGNSLQLSCWPRKPTELSWTKGTTWFLWSQTSGFVIKTG